MFYIGYFCVIFLTVISYNFGFLLQEHQLCICLIYFVCIPYLSYNLQASCLFILYTLFSDPSSPFLAVFSTVLNLSAASNLYLDLHFCDFAGGGSFLYLPLILPAHVWSTSVVSSFFPMKLQIGDYSLIFKNSGIYLVMIFTYLIRHFSREYFLTTT